MKKRNKKTKAHKRAEEQLDRLNGNVKKSKTLYEVIDKRKKMNKSSASFITSVKSVWTV